MRAAGAPSRPAVASVIALASAGSLRTASSIQALNWVYGSVRGAAGSAIESYPSSDRHSAFLADTSQGLGRAGPSRLLPGSAPRATTVATFRRNEERHGR